METLILTDKKRVWWLPTNLVAAGSCQVGQK